MRAPVRSSWRSRTGGGDLFPPLAEERLGEIPEHVGDKFKFGAAAALFEKHSVHDLAPPFDLVDEWHVVAVASDKNCYIIVIFKGVDEDVARHRDVNTLGLSRLSILLEDDRFDQGCPYTSIAFGQRCRDMGVRPSMGSVGDAYDRKVYAITPSAWAESTITWNNRPTLYGPITDTVKEPVLGNIPQNTCVLADITPYVHPRQVNSFALVKDNEAADGLAFYSRETYPNIATADRMPHLFLTTCTPSGYNKCYGATIVTANAQLLPLAASVLLYMVYRRGKNVRGRTRRSRA